MFFGSKIGIGYVVESISRQRCLRAHPASRISLIFRLIARLALPARPRGVPDDAVASVLPDEEGIDLRTGKPENVRCIVGRAPSGLLSRLVAVDREKPLPAFRVDKDPMGAGEVPLEAAANEQVDFVSWW